MQVITNETTKLFYNKYLYKISARLQLAEIFRTISQRSSKLEYALQSITNYKELLVVNNYITIGYYRKKKIYKSDVADAEILRNALLNMSDYILRCEYNSICIFTNDPAGLISSLKQLTTTDRIQVWQPDEKVKEVLASEKNVIVSDSEKTKGFEYKVTINMWKARSKKSEVAEKLKKWITANRNKILITDYSLINPADNFILYVRDEKVLILLKMVAENTIMRVDRIVYKADLDK